MIAIRSEFLKFVIVGVANTAVGLGTIFTAWRYLGLAHVPANVTGYAAGLICSYFLNRRWTFNHRGPARESLWRFLLVVAVAYAANLWVLVEASERLGQDSFLPQLIGAVVYTALGYLGSRFFAFRKKSPRASPT